MDVAESQTKTDGLECREAGPNTPIGYFIGEPVMPATAHSIALHSVLAELMVCTPEKAYEAAKNCGRIAGDRYVLNCLDLQAPPDVFFRNASKVLQELGLSHWEMHSFDEITGSVEVLFNRIQGCRGCHKGIPSMQCAFMRSFWQSILEDYTGHHYLLHEVCALKTYNLGHTDSVRCMYGAKILAESVELGQGKRVMKSLG